MPNIKSAKKRVKVAKRNKEKNVARKSEFRTTIRQFKELVAEGKKEEAQKKLNLVYKLLDQAIQKKVIHKRAGARRKSSLALLMNSTFAK